jgi:hypothetical protein
VNPDESAIKKSAALQGASTGAGVGATIGTLIPIPGVGTAVGAGVGALVGGVAGLLSGSNKASKARKDYQTNRTANLRAANRARDARDAASIYGYAKSGTKTTTYGSFKTPIGKGNKITPIFKSGGKLESPGKVNIIPKGKLHKENNNLGNKDKGIPVVSKDGTKEYELEKDELVLRLEATNKIEELVSNYNKSSDDDILEELGKYITDELKNNTHSYSKKYSRIKIKK